MTRSPRRAFLLLLVLGGVPAGAVAQTAQNAQTAQAAMQVRGVVTDETGGLIDGATVTLTGARTPTTTVTTSPEGRYQVLIKSRDRMTLTVQAPGFATSTQTITPRGN